MACNTSFELHHNFPKLAEEAGFTFNTHRPKVRMDWNKLRLLDVDCLIRERRFVLIEQHLHDILDCVLDSEFDVRILDEGVVKMFRLAQLTVEYQQFCRHYLDRSVYVLTEELKAVTQELEAVKQNIKRKDEEVKKIKRRYKSNPKAPALFYGNDNIANAILKTLTATRPDIFPSSTLLDAGLQYNKCKYCDKVFMNQLYLKSHLDRRHPGMQDLPVKDTNEVPIIVSNNELNHQLQSEVKNLQQKLRDMEDNMVEQILKVQSKALAEPLTTIEKIEPNTVKYKDVEVSVNNDTNLIEKLEEWKTKEQLKHSEELNGLCRQIMESIHSIKEQTTNIGNDNSKDIVDKLYKTITEQGKQILDLKQELSKSSDDKTIMKNHENDEMKVELKICAQKIDAQTKQCEILLENFNKVALQAQEARAFAESESQKAATLQKQLEAHLVNARNPALNISNHAKKKTFVSYDNENLVNRSKATANKKSLEELHRTAQELLNIASSSSQTSLDEIMERPPCIKHEERNEDDKKLKINQKVLNRCLPVETTKNKKSFRNTVGKLEDAALGKMKSNSYPNLITKQENNPVMAKSSPTRIVRAKICEEVHKHLVDTGIDPLTNSIKHPVFEKILNKLQNEQKVKSKNNSAYQRIRNSFLAYLDAQVSKIEEPDRSSQPLQINKAPTKPEKLKSMLSNIKSRALEFVKENKQNGSEYDRNVAEKRIIPKVMSQTKHLPTGHLPIKQVKSGNELNQNDEEMSNESFSEESTASSDKAISINKTSYSVEKLIKSPVRRPSTANGIHEPKKGVITINKAHSSTNLSDVNTKTISNESLSKIVSTSFSDNILLTTDEISNKNTFDTNIRSGPKGVLKNAPSTSSLNKKKVLFDMDAIQMKSLSASPSQSITEKSDSNENYELGLVNLDDEEWDISSIENGLPKEDTKKTEIKALKVRELKQVIEGHLEKRSKAPFSVPVGAVDVLKGTLNKKPSAVGGSNTSLGSSVFDESDEKLIPTRQRLIKGKSFNRENDDDSELDISEFSLDDGNKKDSF